MKAWTIIDYANIGRQWGRSWTMREAYAEACDRSNGTMKVRIDRLSRVVYFRGNTYL